MCYFQAASEDKDKAPLCWGSCTSRVPAPALLTSTMVQQPKVYFSYHAGRHVAAPCFPKAALAGGKCFPPLPPAHLPPELPPAPHSCMEPPSHIPPDCEQQLTCVTSVKSCFSECTWAAISWQNENYTADWEDEPEKVIASLHQRSALDL